VANLLEMIGNDKGAVNWKKDSMGAHLNIDNEIMNEEILEIVTNLYGVGAIKSAGKAGLTLVQMLKNVGLTRPNGKKILDKLAKEIRKKNVGTLTRGNLPKGKPIPSPIDKFPRGYDKPNFPTDFGGPGTPARLREPQGSGGGKAGILGLLGLLGLLGKKSDEDTGEFYDENIYSKLRGLIPDPDMSGARDMPGARDTMQEDPNLMRLLREQAEGTPQDYEGETPIGLEELEKIIQEEEVINYPQHFSNRARSWAK